MIIKSTSPSSQSGLTLLETLIGTLIAALFIALIIVTVNNVREGKRVERTLTAIYTLKEEIKKVARVKGSYTQGRMMPVLFASRSFPDALKVDYAHRIVETPMGQPMDVMGRGQNFSIDLYGMSPDDCYDFGYQILLGNFFILGNRGDDFVALRIGKTLFTDKEPLTQEKLEKACTESFSIDVIMAFR